MPKSKKAKVLPHNAPNAFRRGDGTPPKRGRKMHTFSRLSSSLPVNKSQDGKPLQKKTTIQQQHLRPIVPFGRKDRILLVGEGDFSFAHSLVLHHRCRNVMATCYDSKETLYSKYLEAEKNIDEILNAFPGKKAGRKPAEHDDDADDRKSDDEHDDIPRPGGDDSHANPNPQKRRGPKVLFSIDARKLGLTGGGGKEVRLGFTRREYQPPAWQTSKQSGASSLVDQSSKGGQWDIICFNFPHVGGLSTDVNRQVRSNQELLVAFFKACVPLLSHASAFEADENEDWEDSSDDSDTDLNEDDEGWNPGYGSGNTAGLPAGKKRRTEPGQILVTLFEGEPYTLWNIRDLARHAGLRVVTSFKFPWTSYKGYSHARTLGEVESKQGGRGGWRGEDREARMYVFEVKQEKPGGAARNGSARKKKRARGESDSDDSD